MGKQRSPSDIGGPLEQYLLDTLGAEIRFAPWDASSNLPLFLTERYRFITAELHHQLVIFVLDRSREEESPAAIAKHIALIQPQADRRVVYVRARVSAYNRKRLIQHRVPFIVPGNQMYLPDLGIDLREHFRSQALAPAHFRPATQAIFIHALLLQSPKPLVATELAPMLGYTPMTLTRAFDEIESAELAESRVVGRERYLHFTAPPRELWQRAQPLLRSPVRSRAFIERVDPSAVGPYAGLSALAHYSDIAAPHDPARACSAQHWKSLRDQNAVIAHPLQDSGAVVVEVWSYAPRTYHERDIVDPLSLFLSLKSSRDERVEMALERMLESLPW